MKKLNIGGFEIEISEKDYLELKNKYCLKYLNLIPPKFAEYNLVTGFNLRNPYHNNQFMYLGGFELKSLIVDNKKDWLLDSSIQLVPVVNLSDIRVGDIVRFNNFKLSEDSLDLHLVTCIKNGKIYMQNWNSNNLVACSICAFKNYQYWEVSRVLGDEI